MVRLVTLCLLIVLLGCESPGKRTQQRPPEPTSGTRTSDDVAEPRERHASSLRVAHEGRIVAIADVHGDVAALRTILKAAELIDDEDRWVARDTVLVQTGDILDRGITERQAYDLLFRLRDEAPELDSQVILLVGNHELMNAVGDLRYIVPDAMSHFDDAVSNEERERFAQAPAEVRGRLAAWGPGGPWARKLSEHGFAVIVADSVFVHGGIEPHVAEQIEALNESLKRWLRGEAEMPRDVVAAQDGPVWSRRYGQDPPDCDSLAQTLGLLGVSRMVVGHSVHKSGVSSACDGTIWRIDTGMSQFYGGEPRAIEIQDDDVRVVEPEFTSDSH